MQFAIGDQVVHPLHGVGTVKALSAQRFGTGVTRQYYEVVTDGPTLWVPIDADGLTVLRGIASRHTLNECRHLLSSRPVPLDANHRLRQVEIAARLKGGLLPALCEMVRDLRARSSRAPLPATEDRVLRRIYKALSDEWAAAEGVSGRVALKEIETLLQESRESQLPEEGL